MGGGDIPGFGLNNNLSSDASPAEPPPPPSPADASQGNGSDIHPHANIINWINRIEGLHLTELPPTFPLRNPAGVEYDAWSYDWDAQRQEGRWVGVFFEDIRRSYGDPNPQQPNSMSPTISPRESPDEVRAITCGLHNAPYCLQCCLINPAYHLRCFDVCFKYYGRPGGL